MIYQFISIKELVMKLKLGVLFGGESVEHEISIITANQAIQAIDNSKYEIIPIYVGKDRQLYFSELLFDLNNYKDLASLIAKCSPVTIIKDGNKAKLIYVKAKLFTKELTDLDVLVPIMHGTNCEDGTIQGFIEMFKVPYVGCSLQAAAVGQDKIFMKQILMQTGIPMVNWDWFYASDYQEHQQTTLENIEKKLVYPMIIKPASLGSSVGITTANNRKQLITAIDLAKNFDRKIVVEEMIEDLLEINCSVLGNHNNCEASVVEEVAKSDEILSYKDKYESNSKAKGMANTQRIIPARISKKDTKKVQKFAKDTFLALDCSGVARVDFMQNTKNKKIYVNEINTIPGSLSFYLWKESGIDFSELMDRLVNIALDNFKEKERLTFSYTTNVLKNFSGIKGVKK